MQDNRPSVNGFSRHMLKAFTGMNRYVIGYSYIGGYKPWPKVSRRYYLLTVERMKKQGWIEEAERQGKKLIRLTEKGKMQALFYKLKDLGKSDKKKWDGKWRLAIFDIPEKCKYLRERMRKFLKTVGFRSLQKSVYIYPYKLPMDAMAYLKTSGLNDFIRFLRVDKMDDAEFLKKAFGLKRANAK